MNTYNQILNENNEWIDGEPTKEGERYRQVLDFSGEKKGYVEETFSTLQEPAIIALTDFVVTSDNALLGAGNIWWLPQGEPFTLTANIGLPDTQMMIIIERVANGSTVIDDMRVKASIVGGVVTINAALAHSGNYQITAERLNKGLETIGAPFRLAFDKVEFDAYA